MPTVQAVLTATPGTMPAVDGVTPAQIMAAMAGTLQAYADAFAYVYYTIIPFTVAAAIGESSLYRASLPLSHLTDEDVMTVSSLLHKIRQTDNELEHRPSC